jgi:formate/nitrite transporter
MLLGAELFTGNCLISISVMNGDVSPGMMARNWFFVYIGNFAGAALIAAGCAFFGHLDQSRSLLLHTIKIAAAKCGISFQYGFVMGIFCNVLVCGGVLCSLSAKDAIGRVAGAYIPVALFVICGFEHSIANMYYVPAGIFAASSSEYAQLAYDAGIATSTLSWGNFFLRNLVPVTAGNITGGALTGFIMWRAHVKAK